MLEAQKREEEAEIIRRVRAGETEAYGRLMERHLAPVYRLALRYVKDPDEAEEITQSAFVKAYETIGRFRGEAGFGTYVSRIALSLAVDHLRAARRRIAVLDEFVLNREEKETETPLEQAEIRERLERAVETLPDQQQAAFVLHGVEGRTHEETGRIIGCTAGAVKAHYFHALRKLRAALGDLWEVHR